MALSQADSERTKLHLNHCLNVRIGQIDVQLN